MTPAAFIDLKGSDVREADLFPLQLRRRNEGSMQRTDREEAWLEELGSSVQDELVRARLTRRLRMGPGSSEETDDEIDGWYYEIASFRDMKASLDLFIDNSLGPKRRAVFYGVGSDSRKDIDSINEACIGRWPRPQKFLDGKKVSPSSLRYKDPFLDRWEDEYYYGWYERKSQH